MATIEANGINIPTDTLFAADFRWMQASDQFAALAAAKRPKLGAGRLMVAPANADEAALMEGIAVHAPEDLRQAATWIRDGLSQSSVWTHKAVKHRDNQISPTSEDKTRPNAR